MSRIFATTLVALSSALLSFASPAEARTTALHGATVRIALGGRHERGVGLRGDAQGWRLSLGQAMGATSIVLVDQTSPLHDKWIVAVDGGSLLLDSARFRGGHAYRIEVRRGPSLVEEGFVYLYPTSTGRASRVEFELAEGAEPLAATDIAITPKSAL